MRTNGSGVRAGWRVGRWIIPAVLLFALIVYRRAVAVFGSLIGPTEAQPPSGGGLTFADFRDTVRIPVRDLLAGFNPYDAPAYMLRHPYAAEFDLYAPAHLTLFSPLALMPWIPSAVVYFAGLMASAVLIASLVHIAGRLPRRFDLLLVVSTAVLVIRPMELMVMFGQTSVVPGVAAVVALMRRRPDVATTVAVSLAWLKPQFGIPVCILLLAIRVWRPVAWGTVITFVVSLPALVLAVAHAGGFGEFLASIPRNLQAASESPYTSAAHSVLVRLDVAGLWASISGREPSAALTAALMLVVVGAGAVALRKTVAGGAVPELAFVIAVGTVLLCLPHARYDLVLVAPVLAGLATALLVGAGDTRTTWVNATVAILLAVSALHIQRVDTLLGLTDLTAGRLSSAMLLLAWCFAVAGGLLLTLRTNAEMNSS
jgi:hypothetical protein